MNIQHHKQQLQSRLGTHLPLPTPVLFARNHRGRAEGSAQAKAEPWGQALEGQGAHLGAGAGVALQPGVVLPAGAAALRGLQGIAKRAVRNKEKGSG